MTSPDSGDTDQNRFIARRSARRRAARRVGDVVMESSQPGIGHSGWKRTAPACRGRLPSGLTQSLRWVR